MAIDEKEEKELAQEEKKPDTENRKICKWNLNGSKGSRNPECIVGNVNSRM